MTTFCKGDRVLTPSGTLGVVVAVTSWGSRVDVDVGGNWPMSYEPDALTPADTEEQAA